MYTTRAKCGKIVVSCRRTEEVGVGGNRGKKGLWFQGMRSPMLQNKFTLGPCASSAPGSPGRGRTARTALTSEQKTPALRSKPGSSHGDGRSSWKNCAQQTRRGSKLHYHLFPGDPGEATRSLWKIHAISKGKLLLRGTCRV